MNSNDLRQQFLAFFKEKGHTVIPSASLIPENDPTVLFTTAGMHPLVPYLLGEAHPGGTRLTDVQKCIRTQDIDDVGDHRHTTFFEMLGIWSLGDYFKESIIPWTFEFFTQVLKFDAEKLYVTVFEGDQNVPLDEESVQLWAEQFKQVGIDAKMGERIFAYPKAKNWWGPAGETGPCGPDTEIFYFTGKEHDPKFGAKCHPNCDCGRYVEIGNDVFMQFNKRADGSFEPLQQKNVDVGWGLERLLTMVQGKTSVFQTDLFAEVIAELERLSGKSYDTAAKSMEIIADHIRAATFILGDDHGIVPSNVDQGYILRRFIRRAIRHGRLLGINEAFIVPIAERYIGLMGEVYPELKRNQARIVEELSKEEAKFAKTIEKGLREFDKLFQKTGNVSGEEAFVLYTTYGFPLELTEELAAEKGQTVNKEVFEGEFRKHQELSRAGAEKKFAGGLADHSEQSTKYHTATHLLHEALRMVLGEHVEQKGSNITQERLRFDFSHGDKMTPDQIKAAEDIVNEQIQKDLPVHFEMLTVEEAKARGAIGLFEDKYATLGDQIKVYFVGDDQKGVFSKEICGGPHVERTGTMGHFRIAKEEASSAGVRRIKAVLE